MDAFRRDPVLALLPEDVPDGFLHLEPADQARRGRLWLTLYGAGYEPIHAWWFALSDESDIAEALQIVARVPDEDFRKMVRGRETYEAGKTITAGTIH